MTSEIRFKNLIIICTANKSIPGETMSGSVWLFAFITLKVEWLGS